MNSSLASLAPLPTVETRTPEPRLRGNGVFDEELSTVDLAFVSSFLRPLTTHPKTKNLSFEASLDSRPWKRMKERINS